MLVEPKFIEAFVERFTSRANSAAVSAEQYNELVDDFNSLLKDGKEIASYAKTLREANVKLTDALKKTFDNKSALDEKINQLTSTSLQDASTIQARIQKIVNYRNQLVSNLTGDGNAKSLPIEDKRAINAKLLAYTELLFIAEGTIRYARKINMLTMQNLHEETQLLSQAISSDNHFNLPAITAYGYLSMMEAASTNLSSVMLSYVKLQEDPKAAQAWLAAREAQLLTSDIFIGKSADIDTAKIPVLFTHPTGIKKDDVMNALRVSVSLSENHREPFDRFVHDADGRWPKHPNTAELKKGPNEPRHDIGLVFMDAEQAKRGRDKVNPKQIIEEMLTGSYDPTLMNAPIDVKPVQGPEHQVTSEFIEQNLSKITIK